MTWSDLTVAAAFVVGVLAGATGTIRVTRWVLDFTARAGDRRAPPA